MTKRFGPTLPRMTWEQARRRQPAARTERPGGGGPRQTPRDQTAALNNLRAAGRLGRSIVGTAKRRRRGWERCVCGAPRMAKNCHGRDV